MNAPNARRSGPHLKVVPSPASPRAKAPQVLGVVEQVTLALRPRARLATLMGFLLGGFVPLASYVVAHYEIDYSAPLYTQVAVLLVLGGLVYSARTVYEWGKLAFQSPGKAVGFVVLAEGVMITGHTPWLALSALGYLISINGIATGCNLALHKSRLS